MTIAELIEQVGLDEEYWQETDIYINGKPADDISFGVNPSTNRLIVNIESYEDYENDE